MLKTSTYLTARGPLALLAALLFTGCATKGDLRSVQDEMRALSARQDSLMLEARRAEEATRDSVRAGSRQLFEMRGEVVQLLREIRTDQQRLSELLGESLRAVAGVRDQLESSRRPMGGGPVFGGGAAAPGAVQPAADAVALYNAAIEQYQRQAFTAARAGFELFLESYPSDPELAPWATFYLAECLVQQEEREEAVGLYRSVPERFPASEAVPQVLYRLGLTLIELGERLEARDVLERLVNTYPDDEAAALARERLRELGGSPS